MGSKKGVKRGSYKMSQKKSKHYAKLRHIDHRQKNKKQPEDFSQWQDPADVFNMQQFLQEIM